MEVLLAGNTGYVTETFIEESFPECDVVVLGNEMLKSNRKKNILSRPGSLTVGYQKKVPAGRIKPAFFVSNFWFLSIVFYCNVL